MAKVVKIKKGLSIKLKGEAEKRIIEYIPSIHAVQPHLFRILHPKLIINEGDIVKAGSTLVFDKKNEKIKLTSPISGKVIEIRRGEKRRLEQIVIENNNANEYVDFGSSNPNDLNREAIIEKLLASGLWPTIRQRPFAIIANPNDVPDSIFISGFNTTPLAPDMTYIMDNHNPDYFQAGIDALKKLTSGVIHLNLNPKLGTPDLFLQTKNVQVNQFIGPHPASNVGVQINNISPIIKGDVKWYIGPQDVVAIGRLFLEGRYHHEKVFACTGSEFKETYYFKSIIGPSVTNFLKENPLFDNARLISGDVLTGHTIPKDGFIGYYNNLITAIPEGNYFEFFGWANPGFKKFSMSRTYFSWLFKNRKYKLDTNKHGELRAFVMTGEYEKVFPMKLMPVQLLKACIIKDFELMEQLGIYEVAEEDFAQCEVICTSKIEAQTIIREGIDYIIKETN